MRTNDWLVVVLHSVLNALGTLRTVAADDALGVGLADKSTQLKYRVLEEQPRGTFVGNVLVDARLAARFSLDILRHIRFRFLADSNPLLTIDPLSGVLTTNDVIDRDSEMVCRQRELCEINVDVVLQPVQYFQVIKVSVEIVDINDNPPTFLDSAMVLGVIESALVGSVYVVQGATDYDSPAYGIQKYELDSESNKLDLQINTKVDGSQEVRLILKEKLDRETESRYTMKLIAVDGGPNSMTGSAIVTINVLDSNDNKPKFVGGSNLEVSVVENTPPGTVVVRVQAVDGDDGLNGLVEYTLAGSTLNSPAGQAFAIRNNTGEIVVRGIIDHEKIPVYQLVVVASDRGHDPLSSEATVVIRVEDLNDNAPSLSIRTLTGSNSADIQESSPIGTFVAHVTVNDPDSGANGRVNCSVSHPTAFGLLQKYATEYQLVTASVLDRERTAQYGLTIRCQDGGGARSASGMSGSGFGRVSRVTEKSLQVNVIDVNDNSPVFSQLSYQGTIIENNYIGLSILQVSATDADQGDNARIQYVIPGNVSVLFHVDQRGVITALAKIDRELTASYRFPVMAVDGGSPARTGSALVHVTVEDVNDERPRFLQSFYSFRVSEHELPGTQVGSVYAEDKDGPLYNSVGYSFHSGNTAVDIFAIDQSTGLISTRTPLDREVHGMYHLVVIAYDRKMTSLSSTATVNIQVLDKNDNSPVFIFPNELNNTIYISNQTPVKHVIGHVVAHDADIDDNARLTYRIVDDGDSTGSSHTEDGGGRSIFRIDADRGLVSVNSRLDMVEYRTYRLKVQAVDHGVPARKQTEILNIVVNRSITFGSAVMMPRPGTTTTLFSRNSIVFVLSLVIGGAFLLVIAIVTACALRRQRQRKRRRHSNRRSSQRNEALRSLTSMATATDGVTSPVASPSKSVATVPNGNGSHNRHVDQFAANGKASYTTSRSNVIDVDYRPLSDVSDGGDVTTERQHRHVPPPPPPPRGGLYWRQQQQQPINDQDYAISHTPVSSIHDHVTNISPSNDRRQIGGNGDVTTLRRGDVEQRASDDRVYHIADGHATVRPHHEVIV